MVQRWSHETLATGRMEGRRAAEENGEVKRVRLKPGRSIRAGGGRVTVAHSYPPGYINAVHGHTKRTTQREGETSERELVGNRRGGKNALQSRAMRNSNADTTTTTTRTTNEASKLFHFNNYEPELNTAWVGCKFARFAILIAIGCLNK